MAGRCISLLWPDSLFFVKDCLGHANIQNTTIYARHTTATMDAQVPKILTHHRIVSMGEEEYLRCGKLRHRDAIAPSSTQPHRNHAILGLKGVGHGRASTLWARNGEAVRQAIELGGDCPHRDGQ